MTPGATRQIIQEYLNEKYTFKKKTVLNLVYSVIIFLGIMAFASLDTRMAQSLLPIDIKCFLKYTSWIIMSVRVPITVNNLYCALTI